MEALKKGNFFAGSSGLISKTARSLYPPEFREKSRLHYYSTLFNSIEINSTFYKLPKKETVARWVNDVTTGFYFTFKIPKTISHSPQLKFDVNDVNDFLEILSVVKSEYCLLVQLPPATSIDALPQLERLLATIRENTSEQHCRIAVEFRNNSWYTPDTVRALKKLKTAIVIHDYAKGKTQEEYETANFIYLRFHGPQARYRGDYSTEFLAETAGRITEWQQAGKTVFAYFNNTMGAAYDNLITLKNMVASKPVKV